MGKYKYVKRKTKTYNTSTRAIAKKALRLVNQAELKHIDLELTDTTVNITNGWQIQPINLVAQGDDATDRQGDVITLKSILVRYCAVIASVNATALFRCIIVQDMQTNGALPTVGTILKTASSPISPNNLSNRSRFKVLHDNMYALNNSGKDMYDRKLYKKLNIRQTFGGSTGVIGSVSKNAIYVLYWVYSGNDSTFNLSSRIRFTDK